MSLYSSIFVEYFSVRSMVSNCAIFFCIVGCMLLKAILAVNVFTVCCVVYSNFCVFAFIVLLITVYFKCLAACLMLLFFRLAVIIILILTGPEV